MRTYDVYDLKTGDWIAGGTVAECAAQLGITTGAFHHAKHRCDRGTNAKHRIEERGEIPPQRADREFSGSDLAAIRSWDAFVEPLRKEFGIPVRRMTKEELEGKGRGK